MDFISVLLILLFNYIRPQDWVPGLIGVGIVSPIMMVAIISMILRANKEGRSLRLIQTPQDWAMLVYFVYIVITHPNPSGIFKGSFPLFAFYFVTSQALDSINRLYRYFYWWLIALAVLAVFGVGSEYGFDPTGAASATESQKGRLSLGIWMFNNPNALAHSVVLILPLAYCLYFWKAGAGDRLIAGAFWVLGFECVWQTQSKGAALAGFAILMLSYLFGKSRIFQILVLTVAFAGGGAVLSVMPRMEEMGSLKNDEGVQGRLLAWDQARNASRSSFTGQGKNTFHAIIRWEKKSFFKATHSSYIQIGAELGPIGMFIYVGILWLGLRTILRCGLLESEAERCRRCLFALIVGYAVSSWMIDRAYHTEFFLFMAASSALHRIQLLQPGRVPMHEAQEPVAEPWVRPLPLWHLNPQPALAMARCGVQTESLSIGPEQKPMASPAPSGSNSKLPQYPDFLDLLVAGCGAWLVFYIWDYVMQTI